MESICKLLSAPLLCKVLVTKPLRKLPNSDLDRGKSCLESSDCNVLGSPCISIHTRSFDDFNMPCGADYNINEVSGEFDDCGASKLIDNNGLD